MAAAPAEWARFQDVRTPAAECELAARATVAVRRACPVSSDVAVHTVDAAAVRHHRAEPVVRVGRPEEPRASRRPRVEPAVARSVVASLEDVSQAQAAARVVASCPVPRCATESSAARIAPLVTAAALAALAPQREAEPLRPAPRWPAVLRRELVPERSRLAVLHRRQREAAVRPPPQAMVVRRRPLELRRPLVRRRAVAARRPRPVFRRPVHAA
jgi:hypothetical protein